MFGMAAYMRALSFASTDTISVPFQIVDPRGLSASALEDELRQRKQALADSPAGARPPAAQVKLVATELKDIGAVVVIWFESSIARCCRHNNQKQQFYYTKCVIVMIDWLVDVID